MDDLQIDEGTASKYAHTKERTATKHNPVVEVNIGGASEVLAGGDALGLFEQGPIAVDSPISTAKPVLIGGRGSTATPGVVSADNDVVHAWYSLTGSQHTTVDNTSIAGTAGNANAGVLSIQGVASMTPVQVSQATAATLNCTEASASAIKTAAELIDDAIYVDDADWTDSSSKHMMVGGLYQTTHQTITDGDVGPIQLDVNGRQIIAGGTAADAPMAATTNPVTVGGKVYGVTLTQPGTMSADADVVNASFDPYGRLMVAEINPLLYKTKAYNDTSARAAASAVSALAPTGSRRLIITGYEISTYGTTAARVMFYFGSSASADTTYTAGTDPPVFVGSFVPSATASPGAIMTGLHIVAPAVDYNIMYQNSAAISIDVVWHYYEVS